MMVTSSFDISVLLLAALTVSIAVWKWHVIREHHQILSAIRNALNDRKAFWIGVLAGVFYLAVYMIPGGKGGRIHYLFGRWIWNASAGEVLTGILLAILVMLSMSLFVYSVRVMGAKLSRRKSGMGFFGSLLALLAAFCP